MVRRKVEWRPNSCLGWDLHLRVQQTKCEAVHLRSACFNGRGGRILYQETLKIKPSNLLHLTSPRPCGPSQKHDFLLLDGWILLCCVNEPHFLYPSIHCWILRLFYMLAILTIAAMSREHRSLFDTVALDLCLIVGLLDHMASSIIWWS